MPAPDWTTQYPPGTPAMVESLPYKHLGDLLRQTASQYPSKSAYSICLPNGYSATLNYRQIDQYSDAFALWLRQELKLQPGDRVALQMPNCLAYPIAAFGIFKAGLVLVNINPLYTPTEMEYQLKDSNAKVLVILDIFAGKLQGILEKTDINHVILAQLTGFLPPVKKGIADFVLKYIKHKMPRCPVPYTRFSDTLKLHGDITEFSKSLTLDSLAALQYTGGTTGVAKAAMLSHGNLLWDMELSYQFVKNKITKAEETVLTALPMYHIFAFTVNLLVFIRAVSHNVLIPSPRPISNLKAAFRLFPITWMTGVNTLYASLLNEAWFQKEPPRFLRVAIVGGTSLHANMSERWEQLLGDPIFEGYGLTEASPVLCLNPLNGNHRVGTIGIPLPNTEIKLLDDSNKEIPLGESGELCARGPQVMRSYWMNPAETAKVLIHGWLHTGDIATIDQDGFLKIVGRKKEVIIVSGFKIFPMEVENCLARLNGVAEAGVIGVPSEEADEIVRAYIVCKPGVILSEAQVRAHCKKSLTAYKVPRQVRFMTELPKNSFGKILKKELKAQAMKEVLQAFP